MPSGASSFASVFSWCDLWLAARCPPCVASSCTTPSKHTCGQRWLSHLANLSVRPGCIDCASRRRPCSASHVSACFSLLQLILSHRTLLNQPKPAGFSTSRTSPSSRPSSYVDRWTAVDSTLWMNRLSATLLEASMRGARRTPVTLSRHSRRLLLPSRWFACCCRSKSTPRPLASLLVAPFP
jgi:hypothetical protein